MSLTTFHEHKAHNKLVSREMLFAQDVFLNCQIVLKFCTEHDGDTVVLCAKFQNDLTTEMDAMDERDFVWSEFKMELGGRDIIYYNSPWASRW